MVGPRVRHWHGAISSGLGHLSAKAKVSIKHSVNICNKNIFGIFLKDLWHFFQNDSIFFLSNL